MNSSNSETSAGEDLQIMNEAYEMDEGDPCPVCGWGVVRTKHIPENPDPDHEPHAPGTMYVHMIESTGDGRFRVEGCSEYENGETDAWEPPTNDER